MRSDVLTGTALWDVEASDALPWLQSLPERSVDLFMFSPPYERARLYLENGENLGIARDTEEWVAWMVDVFKACLRACKGLVVCVCEGQTRNYRWSAAPALLMADLHRAGVHLRKPPTFRRIGIPGSGGPDWWRNDTEWCICATNGGKLPWSNNVATGHKPKYGPGGPYSYRTLDGERVNVKRHKTRGTSGYCKGKDTVYHGPGQLDRKITEIVNPGNVINHAYTPDEVAEILSLESDYLNCGAVGGGHLGSDIAHDNEAPYPEILVSPFVRCFSPEGGIVSDSFSGSGTTAKVALKWGRRFIGCDLRESQVLLTKRRIGEALTMFDTPQVEE